MFGRVRVAGSRSGSGSGSRSGSGSGEAQSRCPAPRLDSNVTRLWAERVQVVVIEDEEEEDKTQTNTSSWSLILQRVNPDLLVSDFVSQLETELCGTIRLIHKGKALVSISTSKSTSTQIFTLSNNRNSDSIHASGRLSERLLGDANANANANLLCLVQQSQTSSKTAPSVPKQLQGMEDDKDDILVSSIRTAAATLQSTSMLDITDVSGNLVPMSDSDRVTFLTALGFHGIALKRMRMKAKVKGHELSDPNLQSALVFLLQADQEWGMLDESWRDVVDNYGLLQLDIVWVYLKFRDVENLTDVIQRLHTAEQVLRRQVHTNFVPLALVQADLGHPVPALAAIFVRLFLLKGVAQHFNGDPSKSKEHLDIAWALAKSLRNVSPPDVVHRLCQAVNVAPETAISALRRTNGNGDAAAELIQQDEIKLMAAGKQRRKQRVLGLCENGKDHVDLQLLRQLQTVLGLPNDDDDDDNNSNNNNNNVDDDDGGGGGHSIAGGLLRLTNNNLEAALDMYGYRDNAALLGRVADLDQSQNKPRSRRIQPVDEMALMSLISMGVDDASAREALICNENNVEEALLWLTMTPQEKRDSMGDSDDDDIEHDGYFDEDEANQEDAEDAAQEEAVELLERVLGETFQEQHNGNEEYLGNSLDEEWGYIEQYRARMV